MERLQHVTVKPTVLCMAIGLALSVPSVAQENTSDVEKMTVWGTQVTSSSESILAGDMSLKQADHMSDLLRDIPGVDVGGTHSVNQRITIRGLGETDLDIRLDGASQHANMFHHIGNLTLNPDILKSADIQVGNNSVTQGGLGGSVYFETKDAKDLLRYDENFGARLFGGYASNDSQQGSLTLYGMLSESIDAMVYGHYVTRENFKDGDGVETFGAAGDVSNILAKLGFEPGDAHRFELSFDMYRDSGDYSPRPDMAGSANVGLSKDKLIPTDYDRNTVTLSYELSGESTKGKVAVYSSETDISRDESVMAPAWPTPRVGVNTADNNNTGINAKFQTDFTLASFENTVTYGADYIDQETSSSYSGTEFMKESTVTTAVFAEDKIYLVPNFAVTAGLRFEEFERKAMTSNKTFDEVTWALGADWGVTEDVTLFASARSLFKGPELLETYIRYQDVAYLADDIKPETGLNSQGGVKFDKYFDEHFVAANLTVFQTDIDDYVTESFNRAGGSYEIYNLGDVEIKGFEASVSYGYEAFNSKLSYANSDMKDKTNGGPVAGGNGRSMDVGDSISLALDYQADSIDTLFGWTSIIVKDEDNVFEGSPIKEGYDVHNLYAQWLPNDIDGLSVTFGIDNLFDETYTSHASRSGEARGHTLDDYEPGRNYKLSLAYQY